MSESTGATRWQKGVENVKISLKAARVNAGLTQAQVAERIGCSRFAIMSWESGKVIPRFDKLQALRDLYGIPVENLSVGK